MSQPIESPVIAATIVHENTANTGSNTLEQQVGQFKYDNLNTSSTTLTPQADIPDFDAVELKRLQEQQSIEAKSNVREMMSSTTFTRILNGDMDLKSIPSFASLSSNLSRLESSIEQEERQLQQLQNSLTRSNDAINGAKEEVVEPSKLTEMMEKMRDGVTELKIEQERNKALNEASLVGKLVLHGKHKAEDMFRWKNIFGKKGGMSATKQLEEVEQTQKAMMDNLKQQKQVHDVAVNVYKRKAQLNAQKATTLNEYLKSLEQLEVELKARKEQVLLALGKEQDKAEAIKRTQGVQAVIPNEISTALDELAQQSYALDMQIENVSKMQVQVAEELNICVGIANSSRQLQEQNASALDKASSMLMVVEKQGGHTFELWKQQKSMQANAETHRTVLEFQDAMSENISTMMIEIEKLNRDSNEAQLNLYEQRKRIQQQMEEVNRRMQQDNKLYQERKAEQVKEELIEARSQMTGNKWQQMLKTDKNER